MPLFSFVLSKSCIMCILSQRQYAERANTMQKDELIKNASEQIREQHDIFLVQLLGVENSGLDALRIKELYDKGLIDLNDPGLQVGGVDPFTFLQVAGKIFDSVDHDTKVKMRSWRLDDWRLPVKSTLEKMVGKNAPVASSQMATPPITQITDLKTPVLIPAWMSPAEKGAYVSAITRACSYARGLGNRLDEDLSKVIAEGWQGEQISEQVNPAQREYMLDTIRNETANEFIGSRDAKVLASRLADLTKFYSHNWQRIAQTELQASHNEGRFIDAVANNERVARVPDSDACETCLSLFVGEDGNLLVFEPSELAQNGSNVGKAKGEHKATLFPVHPNCRCDTIPIPQGFYAMRDGRIRREDLNKAIKVPKKYLAGLTSEDKEARTKEIRQRVKGGEEKRTYAPMPGDTDAKTKPSKYTRTELASKVREATKTNSTEEFISVASKISGVPRSIVAEVHKRGAEAWSVGHRPGATQIAWARARVYSFLTGGKTRQTADKDLWAKYLETKKS